jgi:hypothetical protein
MYSIQIGVDFMVFWDAESISEVFKMIGCQGHMNVAKVIVIFFKKLIVFVFLHVLFLLNSP